MSYQLSYEFFTFLSLIIHWVNMFSPHHWGAELVSEGYLRSVLLTTFIPHSITSTLWWCNFWSLSGHKMITQVHKQIYFLCQIYANLIINIQMNSVITFNYSKNLLLKNFIAASRALIVAKFKNRSSFCSFRWLIVFHFDFQISCF